MRLPTGTVTFLFTDIEGSTRLLHELGAEAYAEALATHRRSLRAAFTTHGGVEVATEGDSFFVAFVRAGDAVGAALASQAALDGGPIRARMGLHTGAPILADEGYVGMDVHRAARIAAVAHGGQVLLSEATRQLAPETHARDLGLHLLKDLGEPLRLFQLGDETFPALRSLNVTRLPMQPTPLLGRDDALDRLAELLERDDVRLVTLTGPGGIGKTRLALAGASRVAASFADGVHWIALQALRDPDLVLPAIAQALETTDVAAAVGDRKVLLVLDNFEQIVDAATVVSDLLTACPRLAVLATSREPLHLRAEHEWPVPPLAERAAVALFVERAQAVRPDFVAAAEADAICRRLDCLPLAIELAAAHVRSLPQSAILERLERRLDLLRDGPRDLPERQRTLHATIGWSHDLLREDEQLLFQRLGVFAGGCTAEAAEAVCGAGPDALSALVEKSLLVFHDGRYSMLETIREYARERLEQMNEAPVLRDRHARHYLEVAREADEQLTGPQQAEWLTRLAHEQDNVRGALARASVSDHELAVELAAAAGWFWFVRGQLEEGTRWLEATLATGAGAPATRATVSMRAGAIADARGDYAGAEAHYREALKLRQSGADLAGAVSSLNNLGTLAHSQADYDAANAWYEQSLALARKIDDELGIATALGNMGVVAVSSADPARAVELLEESVARNQQLGHQYALAVTRQALGCALLDLGNERLAADHLSQALILHRELEEPLGVAATLDVLAALAASAGDGERAAAQLGAASAIRGAMGATAHAVDEVRRERAVAAARGLIGPERYDEMYREGFASELDVAVESSLAACRRLDAAPVEARP